MKERWRRDGEEKEKKKEEKKENRRGAEEGECAGWDGNYRMKGVIFHLYRGEITENRLGIPYYSCIVTIRQLTDVIQR